MAKRAGCRSTHFVAATNVNDVVPVYLSTGRSCRGLDAHDRQRDGRRPSRATSTACCGCTGDVDAMRRDIVGSRHMDDEVRGDDPACLRDARATSSILTAPSVPRAGSEQAEWWQEGGRAFFWRLRIRPSFTNRRADHRPRDREAAGAGRRSRAPQHIMRIDASLDAVKEKLLE